MREIQPREWKKRGKSIANCLCRRRSSKDSTKRWYLLAINIAALTLSILVIYSCNFFSYKEVDVFNDGYSSEADLSYEPFEYLPRAGVGLFSYFMGDPTGKGVMTNDQMCFYYCDEFTDYQWLSSNTEETGSVDKWVLARYCSILAPVFGLLAFLQILVEAIRGYKMPWCGSGMYLKTQILLIAAFFQIGTFVVVLAPPIMYSTSVEDLKQQFCFSNTSNVRCKMDTGSILSLASTVMYLILAHASFYTQRPSKEKETETEKGIDPKDGVERDTDESSVSDISDSDSESNSETNSKDNPEGNDDNTADSASVFSTLIQYFGRNQKIEDIDEMVVETESNAKSDNNMEQGIIDDNVGHNRNHNEETSISSLSGSDEHGAIHATVSRESIHYSMGNKEDDKRGNIGTRQIKTDIYSNRKQHESIHRSYKNKKGKSWDTDSSSMLRGLGIKLNRMLPFSGFKNELGPAGSF